MFNNHSSSTLCKHRERHARGVALILATAEIAQYGWAGLSLSLQLAFRVVS